MRLKTGNPRVRGPRKPARNSRSDRGSRHTSVEPSTFAWTEPLGDVEPIVVEKEVVVERSVPTQVVVEKQVFVDRPVTVEKPVVVERVVEKVVEKQVFVDRPVPVEKQVVVERQVPVEKQVFVDRPVPVAVPFPVAAEPAVADAAVTKIESKPEKKAKKEKQPKAIIIGRGPSFASKLARFAPKPTPVIAGAAAMLIAIAGVALISPSSENADAAHGGGAFAKNADGATGQVPALNTTKTSGPASKSRDPFAAKNYDPPKVKKAAAKPGAKSAAKAPTVATPSLFAANFTTYSSYTPWAKSTKRSGSWIDFGGKPTVKVLSVGKAGVDLFVVTDVEVIPEKSKNFKYDNPLRQVHLNKGGVVRFADYRGIEGDDVTYTIRYGGSVSLKPAGK
ncbi:MAG: hypothetical protein ACRDKI_10580 [Solirubrobacterales bacterium]